jgi:exodeoxyribonuclease VII large subunit
LTGIGHEIDLSVADMVSFRHFVTPTDTARFLKSRMDDFSLRVENASNEISGLSKVCLSRGREHLKMLTYKLTTEVTKLERASKESLAHLTQNLVMAAVSDLSFGKNTLNLIASALASGIRATQNTAEKKLSELDKLLLTLDPSSTLKRGFSITLGPDGKAIMSAEHVDKNARIRTILNQGALTSTVISKENP